MKITITKTEAAEMIREYLGKKMVLDGDYRITHTALAESYSADLMTVTLEKPAEEAKS